MYWSGSTISIFWLTSISEAFDSRNTAYQRIALGLGWKTWDVRAKDELGEAIKAEAKKSKKPTREEIANKRRAAAEKRREKAKELRKK